MNELHIVIKCRGAFGIIEMLECRVDKVNTYEMYTTLKINLV